MARRIGRLGSVQKGSRDQGQDSRAGAGQSHQTCALASGVRLHGREESCRRMHPETLLPSRRTIQTILRDDTEQRPTTADAWAPELQVTIGRGQIQMKGNERPPGAMEPRQRPRPQEDLAIGGFLVVCSHCVLANMSKEA